jgi:fructose/tagatose bisphosphate aldolase
VQKTAKLNFELIKELRDTVDSHLVLQGGTHISDEAIRKSIELGVSEIKVAAHLAIAWADTIKEYLNANPDDTMTPNILRPALSAVKELTVNSMRLFGSSGKA